MVSKIRFYIEGGGDSSDTKSLLREGFRAFFSELWQAARPRRVGLHLVVCGGRDSTFDAFKTDLDIHKDSFNVILVDAEGECETEAWSYLRQRDRWQRPANVVDEQCYLMVQSMETWFIADIDALQNYYGQGFNPNPIPRSQQLESVDRHRIAQALQEATRHTQKRKYHKIQHGSALLARINPAKVRAALPHFDRIFTTLLGKIEE